MRRNGSAVIVGRGESLLGWVFEGVSWEGSSRGGDWNRRSRSGEGIEVNGSKIRGRCGRE